MDPTQAPPDGHEEPPEPPVPGPPSPGGAGEPGPEAPAAEAPSPQRGLLGWIFVIAGGSVACVLLQHAEMSVFLAAAGILALAQASDAAAAHAAYRHWVHDTLPAGGASGRVVRLFVRAVVPGMGALTYLAIGAYAAELGQDLPHRFAAIWSYVAAGACLLLVARPVADRITSLLFRSGGVGRTRRLAARLVVIALLLPPPMQALQPDLLDAMRSSPTPLADAGALIAQLIGEIAVALAGVGWLVRRATRDTVARLGIEAVRIEHLPFILVGLLGAIGINAGMETMQHALLPELWQRDQQATQLIAGTMPVWTALVLGLSAGLGEEIMLRGALQPRLGIVLTSVLFACGHVQYTWFGMLTITLLGVLLGLVRRRTNTSAAILVHGLYDVFAVLTSQF
jgi:membrane protease YdiL (CAAX protease family)